MFRTLMALLKNNKGVTAIEYGVLAALIIVVVAGTITTIGTTLKTEFGAVVTALGG